jgi:hypothetical protein
MAEFFLLVFALPYSHCVGRGAAKSPYRVFHARGNSNGPTRIAHVYRGCIVALIRLIPAAVPGDANSPAFP